MYANTRFSSYAKRATDRVITRAYAALSTEERNTFADLLHAVRTRAVVRVCPMVVSALRNIARFAAAYVRRLEDWPGAAGTRYPVVDSLVQYLLARHALARFLTSVWYGEPSERPTPPAAGSSPMPPAHVSAILTCRCR